jgi:hypothetical protein
LFLVDMYVYVATEQKLMKEETSIQYRNALLLTTNLNGITRARLKQRVYKTPNAS